MSGRCRAREAGDQAARCGVPVRRAKAGERRHHVDATIVRKAGGGGSAFVGALDEFEVVTQPFDDGAGIENGPFERHRGGARQGIAERAEQAVSRTGPDSAGIGDEEGAGAKGHLRLAGREAGLADEGGLLISEYGADRDGPSEQCWISHAEVRCARADLWQ